MKNGLSYFADGGDVEAPDQLITPTKIAAPGKAALDPTQTAELLANMQSMIDARQSPMNILNRGLERAAAWGSGGIQGPSAALAQLNQREQAEEKSTFDMRQQMAAFKTAQAQQEAFNKRKTLELGTGVAGEPSASNEATMPPQIRMALSNAKTQDEYNKIYNAWAQKQAEIYARPEMDEPKIPVVENVNGQWVRRTVSAREYRANPNKYRDTPQTQAAVNTATTPASPATGITPAAIRQVESGGNAAAVSPKGAEGTMQVMPATQTAPGFGVTPAANKTPQELERVGGDYFAAMKRKYGDDVTAAIAYNMGPGATDKWIAAGKNFDQLPVETQGYVNKLTSQTSVPEISKIKAETMAAPTRPLGPRPTPAQLEQEEKAQEAYKTGISKGQAENIVKDELSFRASTEPKSVAERKTSAERVVNLVEQNPKAVGVLTKPGVGTALMTVARDGLNTPSGAIGIKTIEDALVLAMPGVDQKTVNARKEIAQNLARGALEASKLSQGQGSVSDFERSMFERIAGSLADTPDLLIKRQKMLIARAELDQKLGNMYRATKAPGKPSDYEAFASSPAYASAVDQYEENLRKILGSEVSLNKQGPVSGKTPSGIQFKVITPAKAQ